jgi:hypothetical protein
MRITLTAGAGAVNAARLLRGAVYPEKSDLYNGVFVKDQKHACTA